MSKKSRTEGSNPPALTDLEREERAREKARLRKQKFDARLRQGDSGGPRVGRVFYLNGAAIDALRLHRTVRKAAGAGPEMDSQLLESLLSAYAERLRTAAHYPHVEQVESEAAKVGLRLPDFFVAARAKLLEAQVAAVQQIEEERGEDEQYELLSGEANDNLKDAGGGLLDAHRKHKTQCLELAKTMAEIVATSANDAEILRRASDEVHEYLQRLIPD